MLWDGDVPVPRKSQEKEGKWSRHAGVAHAQNVHGNRQGPGEPNVFWDRGEHHEEESLGSLQKVN